MKKAIILAKGILIALPIFVIFSIAFLGCGKQTTMVSIDGGPSIKDNIYDQWLIDTAYSTLMEQIKSSSPFSNDTFNLEIDKDMPMYPAFEYKLFKILGRWNNTINIVANPSLASNYDVLKINPLIFGIHSKKEYRMLGLSKTETKYLDVKLAILRVHGGKIQNSLVTEAYATLRQKTLFHLFTSVYLNCYYGSSKEECFDTEMPSEIPPEPEIKLQDDE